MRALLLIALLTLSSTVFSQTAYPKFEIDSAGQQVVVMTLEQAQALDNATDLLAMFESVGAKLGDYDSICVKVITEKESVISSQVVQIEDLRSQISVKEQKIGNLRTEIAQKDSIISNQKTEIQNKDGEISLHIKEIQNNRLIFGFGGGVVGVIVGVIIGLFAGN